MKMHGCIDPAEILAEAEQEIVDKMSAVQSTIIVSVFRMTVHGIFVIPNICYYGNLFLGECTAIFIAMYAWLSISSTSLFMPEASFSYSATGFESKMACFWCFCVFWLLFCELQVVAG